MWNKMFYIFTFLPQLAVTTSRTREIHSSADRKLIDKRRLTHVHTHSHTLSQRVLRQPDREVYIISLGGQPEQTQSFNFHDSLSEREKETERETERRKGRKPINENLKDTDKKDKHCIKMVGNVWKYDRSELLFHSFVLLLEHLVSLGFVQTCLPQAALTPETTTHIWLFWMTGILLSIDPKHYTYRNWQPRQKEQHEQTKALKRFSYSLCLYLFVFFKADEDDSLSFLPLLRLLAQTTVTAHLSQLF